MPDFRAKMHQKSISAGALPQTPLDSAPPAGFGGHTSKGREERRRGKGKDDCYSKLFLGHAVYYQLGVFNILKLSRNLEGLLCTMGYENSQYRRASNLL